MAKEKTYEQRPTFWGWVRDAADRKAILEAVEWCRSKQETAVVVITRQIEVP